MCSEFRRNLSRSCKRTGCSPVYGTAAIRLTAARSCPVLGWVCVAAAVPDPSSYTASLPSPSPRATKQHRLCRDRFSRPPMTSDARPLDRADAHKVTGRSAGWYPKVVTTHSPEARPVVERLDRMRPVAAAGWQLDVDAGARAQPTAWTASSAALSGSRRYGTELSSDTTTPEKRVLLTDRSVSRVMQRRGYRRRANGSQSPTAVRRRRPRLRTAGRTGREACATPDGLWRF